MCPSEKKKRPFFLSDVWFWSSGRLFLLLRFTFPVESREREIEKEEKKEDGEAIERAAKGRLTEQGRGGRDDNRGRMRGRRSGGEGVQIGRAARAASWLS